MKQAIDEQFLQQIEQFTLAVKDNVAGLFGGNHKSKKYGSSCEFADYRDYIEGDDVTKIDWNLYGKFEKRYLKLYLDERQRHTRIYIDTSRSRSFFNKDEMALKIASTLAFRSVSDRDKVTIYALKGNYAEPIIEKIVTGVPSTSSTRSSLTENRVSRMLLSVRLSAMEMERALSSRISVPTATLPMLLIILETNAAMSGASRFSAMRKFIRSSVEKGSFMIRKMMIVSSRITSAVM